MILPPGDKSLGFFRHEASGLGILFYYYRPGLHLIIALSIPSEKGARVFIWKIRQERGLSNSGCKI
jgi:hypothetical protein